MDNASDLEHVAHPLHEEVLRCYIGALDIRRYADEPLLEDDFLVSRSAAKVRHSLLTLAKNICKVMMKDMRNQLEVERLERFNEQEWENHLNRLRNDLELAQGNLQEIQEEI